MLVYGVDTHDDVRQWKGVVVVIEQWVRKVKKGVLQGESGGVVQAITDFNKGWPVLNCVPPCGGLCAF